MELVATMSTGHKLSMDIAEDHIFLQLGEGERVSIFLDRQDSTPALHQVALKLGAELEKVISKTACKLQDAILSEAV